MKVIELNNPLIKHKLSILRNKNTGTKEFREIVNEIATLECYEAMQDAKLIETTIETPMETTTCKTIDENNYAFIPILRAGLSMVDGVIRIFPNAKIGHIGLYRDENTLKPQKYYYKVPSSIEKRTVFILDPMLATGGSAAAAIEMLKEAGAKKIKLLTIISAPEGIKSINEKHPEVEIYTAEIDRCLNEFGYIVPGLGDAGDRIFGTK